MTKMIPGKAGPKSGTIPSGRIPVSTNFYGDRPSFGGADGLGKYNLNEHVPLSEGDPETTQRAKNYSNDVKRGWMLGDDVGGKGGAPGIGDNKPYFDQDKSRAGNSKPMMKDGGNCEKSPFSSAKHATSADSDWTTNYKPRKY